MSEWRLTPLAENDITDIWRHTEQTWSAPQAERYITLLFDAFDRIAAKPMQGRPSDDIRPGYRRLAVGAHVVFYVAKPYGVDVVRILHQSMDIDAKFKSD